MEIGVLLRRYKRFLADVEFPDGRVETVHCANTGAMTGCADPGSIAWCSTSASVSRKYPRTLEVVEVEGHRIAVNTGRANELVSEALVLGLLPPFHGYEQITPEARTTDGQGRFDFLLHGQHLRKCYIEVKSVTWRLADGRGRFPDARSVRASRHVESLVKVRRMGDRAVLLFCVQHSGIDSISAAADIDPVFANALNRAFEEGVEVYAYQSQIELHSLSLSAEQVKLG